MASGDQYAFLQPKDFNAVNGSTPFPSWSRSRLVSGDSDGHFRHSVLRG